MAKVTTITTVIEDTDEPIYGCTHKEKELHFCYECKSFHRHYVQSTPHYFTPLNCGHCVPQKPYAHSQNRKATDKACAYFIAEPSTQK